MLRLKFCKSILILASLSACLVQGIDAFSECSNSGLADPSISGVTDCPSWLAYLQSTGQDVVSWCSNSANYQKCCITCRSKFVGWCWVLSTVLVWTDQNRFILPRYSERQQLHRYCLWSRLPSQSCSWHVQLFALFSDRQGLLSQKLWTLLKLNRLNIVVMQLAQLWLQYRYLCASELVWCQHYPLQLSTKPSWSLLSKR